MIIWLLGTHSSRGRKKENATQKFHVSTPLTSIYSSRAKRVALASLCMAAKDWKKQENMVWHLVTQVVQSTFSTCVLPGTINLKV